MMETRNDAGPTTYVNQRTGESVMLVTRDGKRWIQGTPNQIMRGAVALQDMLHPRDGEAVSPLVERLAPGSPRVVEILESLTLRLTPATSSEIEVEVIFRPWTLPAPVQP